ncbi:MOSC domain-containing protein [Breoghania corrubedonensis]|uniref:MOSC domain-containing protein n=1 Tax=Breoghania corrubedonensis TaxID=665038 RepID=A0A2T5V529_9HYPH|nr:MOSC domain-containing protein [Breoghania corrubedonensis]PTW58859.1 MOSC domain-containing protein [Breoghania corrubedonensis]
MSADLFSNEMLRIHPARKISGTVARLLAAEGDAFPTSAVESLTFTFEGIPGDFHAGSTRRSGGREPWYPRGTEMRNERQISILAVDELAEIAKRMEIEKIEPEWIGANVVMDGLPRLSMIPPRTRLVFENGAVLRVDGQNGPCRIAGKSIAAHYRDREGLDLAFPKVAARLRGLVAWVEKPGTVAPGEAVTANIPEQWIYEA